MAFQAIWHIVCESASFDGGESHKDGKLRPPQCHGTAGSRRSKQEVVELAQALGWLIIKGDKHLCPHCRNEKP